MLAASRLFLQQGYGLTRMDLIAQEAGVTKQTVYRYFVSKEALFAAVMETIRNNESIPYTFSSGSEYEELLSYGKRLLAFHLQPDTLGLYRLMLTEGDQENLVEIFMNTGPRNVQKPLTDFLRQRYPDLKEFEFCARMFITMTLAPRNQLLMNGKTRLTVPAQKKHVEKVTQYFLKMIES